MTPITANVRRLVSYVGLWLLAGVLLAGAVVHSEFAGWPLALVWALPMAVCLGFVAASAFYVGRTVARTQRETWRTPVVFGAASLIAGLVWSALCVVWNALGAYLVQLVDAPRQASLLTTESLVALAPGGALALALAGSAVYLIALLLHAIGQADLRLRDAQAREALSRLQTRDAQLQALRAQINPHFLFNSLNSISALTTQSPADARTMTLELAAFFRKTLQSAESERIALSEEVALCTHFLAVEKVRYGDRLQTHIDIAKEAQAARIPPMLLQPCVENAVKHGIRHLPEGGCIALHAQVRGAWLYASVTNPIDADALTEGGTGMGLANIRQRVAAAYAERARVTWTRNADSFSVEIVLPCAESVGTLGKDFLP